MPASTNEVDVILNRVNVTLARSQRLIASWLPPRSKEETANAKSEAEIEREEQEIFTPVPEVLGLGAPVPQDANGGNSRYHPTHNDTLRKKLIGKGSHNRGSATREEKNNKNTAHKSSQKPSQLSIQDEDDEEQGRSGLGSGKRRKMNQVEDITNLSDGREERQANGSTKQRTGGSYLDEVLSARSSKRKKKKRWQGKPWARE